MVLAKMAIQNSKNDMYLRNIKILPIINFSTDSLDYGRILKKSEFNPWICITVSNYTVLKTLIRLCVALIKMTYI